MIKKPLSGQWNLKKTGDNKTIKAMVPGSVYSDLLKNNIMADPFWRANENDALRLMDNDYIYSRNFSIDKDLLNAEKILLICEGLDTIAQITINDKTVGFANNMHRIWEFDIKSYLSEGQNSIEIHFSSPTKHIGNHPLKPTVDGASDAMEGFPLIRKAHCMYGWDWGPRLPDAGIWRDIYIEGIDTARILQVQIAQEHTENQVELTIDTEIEYTSLCEQQEIQTDVTITYPDGIKYTICGKSCKFKITEPELWWPNGFGDQPLYEITVSLIKNKKIVDEWSNRIGLRTMTMHIEKDEWGEKFCHQVNGIDIFAMGADYIPEDNIFSRINKERTRILLEDAATANFNTIRVWGGGYYPDDYFYDICDELGLIVWQDFMFACASYNLTQEFDENIRAEIKDNVRRIRHHACLGLWCGNNEMEMFAVKNVWCKTPKQKSDYIKMYEYIIPEILKQEDPNTFYWPASPSSGGNLDNPNDENRGDVHYWDVWHGLKPFTEYRKFHFRYASEFGFQSFPSMKTIESFTEEKDRNPFSYVMEKHQRNASANGRILSYISQMYLYPKDFDTMIYASQLLQAQAIQYGVEHWRRHRGRCMGAIIWQLNDCWPVASWSSIDYYGRWKALHYYAKRFFAPVLISCHEEGLLSQNTNVNAEKVSNKKTARLNISNETTKEFTGIAKWQLRNPDASIIKQGCFAVSAEPLSTVWLPEQDFSDYDAYSCYYSYTLESDKRVVGEGSILFCQPKHFKFENPNLTVKVKGDTIEVSAQKYARSVEIMSDTDILLSDNYFDINSGKKVIKILRGSPENIQARCVFNIK